MVGGPIVTQHAMRLLIAGVRWPPETFLARLIHGLSETGLDVTVGYVSLVGQPKPVSPEVRWLRLPVWEGHYVLRLFRVMLMVARAALIAPADVFRFLQSVRKFRRMRDRAQDLHRLLPFAGRRWDIIYFPWINGAITYWPLFDDPSVIVSCRGRQINIDPHVLEDSLHAACLKRAFEQAEAMHCVSEAILKEAEQLGLSREKAVVIRPAVDPEVFRPLESRLKPGSEFIVVTTGSLIWRKGMEYALSSIRKLRDRGVNVRFEIIGDGPERQRVLYTIHDLRLQDCVRLHGHLRPEEVLQRLQQADAFLLSSLSEGISNAVLEAMACGLPVVTTDCGGMREAVTDGVEGFVVPVRDAEAMAAALLKLAGNAGLRQRIGAAARSRILREFSLKRQITQWLELFHSVVRHDKGNDELSHCTQPEDWHRADVAPAESLVRAVASNPALRARSKPTHG